MVSLFSRKTAVVEPLFAVAAVPAAKEARQRLDTLLKTNQSVTMNISPVMAEVMLEHNTGNRPLNRRNVSRLAKMMKAGDWHLTGHSIVFSKDGTLNDGQHRLSAIVESGMTIRADVRFGIERAAFAYTDIGDKRTSAHALGIAGEKNAALLAAAIRLSISFESNDFNFKTPIAPADAFDVLEKTPAFREAAAKAVRWCKEFAPITPSVFAFTYRACAAISSHEADLFFSRLATGVDIKRATDPVNVARRYFINAAEARGARPIRDQVAVIFKAWNAWRAGETRKYLRLRVDGAAESFPIPR